MDDPIWLTVELAMDLHERQLALHGGQDGVRNPGLLESAIGRPRHLFAYIDPTPSLAQLAASYAFGIARNHPFLDGNKRTATVACELFLRRNGVRLTATNDEAYPVFLGLAAGTVGEAELADWLGRHTRPLTAE